MSLVKIMNKPRQISFHTTVLYFFLPNVTFKVVNTFYIIYPFASTISYNPITDNSTLRSLLLPYAQHKHVSFVYPRQKWK